ncbi:MAG TPA: thioredoxin domain-containing protein [Polyangiaceae bacterium]|jgi:thioredoxin 1
MSPIKHANDSSFDAEVLAAPGTVLVKFGATWCPPCRALEPIVAALAKERESSLKVVDVDMDESPEVSRRFGVRAVPTLMVFRDGKRIVAHVGAVPKQRIVALLES